MEELHVPTGDRAISILVIEDELVARVALKCMLLKCGYQEVNCVSSANEALRYLSEAIPHLILCDVGLPDINGVEFLDKLFSIPAYSNIPVAMISGSEELQLVYSCLKRGATSFLVKPVHLKQLENLWQFVWKKKKDTENVVREQEIQAKRQEEVEQKIAEIVSTPIKAIMGLVSKLLSSGDVDTSTRETLSVILNTLLESQFYRPSIESYILSSNIDQETKRWFADALNLEPVKHLSQESQELVPLPMFDSEVAERLRMYDFDVWSIKDEVDFYPMISSMFEYFRCV